MLHPPACRTGAASLSLLAAAAACPSGDDAADPSSGDGSPSTSATSTGATGTGNDAADATGTTTADDIGPGTTHAPADSSTGGEESGTVSGSGGAAIPIELINDGWGRAGPASYQGGFVQGECWASSFVPPRDAYPFVVDATRMLVGGETERNANFSLALWSTDEANQPLAELSVATVELTGINDDIDAVNLALAGIDSPVFSEGGFALVGCLIEHDGFPAIAADQDGQVDAVDRNWIRLETGDWVTSASLGLTGDWVMRAFILPTG